MDNALPKQGISLVPRSKYLALIAFVALFLCVAELADVFDLPLGSVAGGSASSGSVFSLGFLNSLLGIGYAGLFALMTMENSSLPVPSEVVLPLAGYLAFEGKMSLPGAIAVATVAGVFGSLIAYYIGLALGRPIVYSLFRRVGVSSSHLDNGEKWIDSKGAWSVFVARFIPGLRSVISIPAGLLKMRMKEFLPLTAAGSFIWSAALVYAGYSAGPLWQRASGSASALVGQAALVIIAAVSVLYLAYFLGAFGRREQTSPMTSEANKLLTLDYYRSFIKFGIVGAIGIGVNEGLLVAIQSAGVYFLYAGAISIEVSILSNFVLNDIWTFRDRRTGSAAARLVKFNLLMLVGLVLNLAVLDVGTVYFGMAAVVANLFGIAAALVLRYALSVKYAWMKPGMESS